MLDKDAAREMEERLAQQERMLKAGAEFSALLDKSAERKKAATEAFLDTLRSSKASREEGAA